MCTLVKSFKLSTRKERKFLIGFLPVEIRDYSYLCTDSKGGMQAVMKWQVSDLRRLHTCVTIRPHVFLTACSISCLAQTGKPIVSRRRSPRFHYRFVVRLLHKCSDRVADFVQCLIDIFGCASVSGRRFVLGLLASKSVSCCKRFIASSGQSIGSDYTI